MPISIRTARESDAGCIAGLTIQLGNEVTLDAVAPGVLIQYVPRVEPA